MSETGKSHSVDSVFLYETVCISKNVSFSIKLQGKKSLIAKAILSLLFHTVHNSQQNIISRFQNCEGCF